MKLKGLFSKLVIGVVFIGGVSYTSCKISDYIYYKKYKKDITSSIEMFVDLDGDNFRSHPEWAKVYGVVRPGIKYDARNPPSDLTIEEMEKYLIKKEKDLKKANDILNKLKKYSNKINV